MWCLLVAFVFANGAIARTFNNPLITDIFEPSVMVHNGVHYAISASPYVNTTDKYPVYFSSNFDEWTYVTSLFTEDNFPEWMYSSDVASPQIFVLGEREYRLYFAGIDKTTGIFSIGVAFAFDFLGPYQPLKTPIYQTTRQSFAGTVFQDGDSLYMVWSEGSIYGQQLSDDGLSLRESSKALILTNGLDWEGAYIFPSQVSQRDGAFYLFYSSSVNCANTSSAGVARSRFPLGPYEKMGEPLLKSIGQILGPRHPTIVKDVDGFSDVIAYEIHTPSLGCSRRQLWAQTLTLDQNGWPILTS